MTAETVAHAWLVFVVTNCRGHMFCIFQAVRSDGASRIWTDVQSSVSDVIWLSISVSSWRHNKILVENLELSPNPSVFGGPTKTLKDAPLQSSQECKWDAHLPTIGHWANRGDITVCDACPCNGRPMVTFPNTDHCQCALAGTHWG